MDLPKRQVRMLEVQLFGTPPVCSLLDNQLHDFHRRAGDAQNALLIQHYMFITSLHQHSPRMLVTDL